MELLGQQLRNCQKLTWLMFSTGYRCIDTKLCMCIPKLWTDIQKLCISVQSLWTNARGLWAASVSRWNRSLSLRTLTMTRPLTPWVSSNVRQGRIFFTLCILKHFVDIIWSNNAFKDDLISLRDKYPMIDIAAMGFPSDNWQDEPLWNDQQ